MAKKPKYVPSVPTSSEDVAAADARNKGVARIGDTPLAVGGVMRDGKVEGLNPKAYNFRAPGKSFAYNMRANGGEAIKRERENTMAYSASLPGAKKSATMNALALAKARKKGAK